MVAVLDFMLMSKSPKHRNGVGHMIESLEGRTLMAAARATEPMLYTQNQILHLEGTKASEHITIGLNADRHRIDLTVNGVTTTLQPEFLTGIVIDGKGGKDHIEVLENHGPMPVAVTLVGGAGRDELVAGEGHVKIQGRLRELLV
jgi:hypothetical protein